MAGITNAQIQLAIVNQLVQSGGVLNNDTIHLSNANIVCSRSTTLGALTECTFPGYAPVPGQTGSGGYIGPDQAVHSTFEGQLFAATNGAQQIMSNIALGTISMAGSLAVVVTAAGMTGTPVTLAVPVLTTDTPAQIAEKIAIVAQDNADVGPFFTITTSGNVVTFKAVTAAANDLTMNVSFATGTATGLTTKATATQIAPGQAPGATISDQITAYFVTDYTGTVLVMCANTPSVIPVVTVGQGAFITADYVYGG